MGSLFGGQVNQNSNQAQQSTSQTSLPNWVTQTAQQDLGFAQDVAMRPLQQYQGQRIADPGAQTLQGEQMAANAGNAGQGQFDLAQSGYLSAMGYSPQQVHAGSVTPQTLASTNLNPYMNPYTQSVINATMPIIQQQLGIAKQGIGDQAVAQNAFGGSRQGVQEGVADAQAAMQAAQLGAQLNQANFAQAQQGAIGDITRNLQGQEFNTGANLQAQLANQTAGQNAVNSAINAASGLSNLGTAQQRGEASQFAQLMGAGAAEQGQAQSQIDSNINQFNQAWNYPTTQLSTMLQSLGMTPYGTNTTTQGTGTSSSQTSQTPNYASAITSALQGLGSMFVGSDRRLKTDITQVDTHPSGLPIYSYRYKGDPKSYPKVMGPMAEDVMKVAPHAVSPMGVGGRLAVNMNALPGGLTGSGPSGLMGGLGTNLTGMRRGAIRGTPKVHIPKMPKGGLGFG